MFFHGTLNAVRFKIVAALLILIVALLSVIAIALLLRNWNTPATAPVTQQKAASISGTFDINGVIPAGASITLTQKVIGSSTSKPQIFASNLPVADRSPWSFNKGIENKSYEIQAQVVVNGSIVSSSDPINVTAPADEEVLVLDIESEKHSPNTVISGNIVVAGYIPAGSKIVIKGRKLGAVTFTTVASNLIGQANQFMSYSTALSGVTYEIEGVLLNSNGQVIGTSNILAVTAPAVNEQLTINSSAVPAPTSTPAPAAPTAPIASPVPPPPSTVNISGGINFNGAAPNNSRIVIFQQAAGAANNQVAVNNVTPLDGTTWTWTGAQNGTWYTLIAVLKQHNSDGTDTDIATSSPVQVAAPASNVIFTINSGTSLSAPGGPITVNCQTYNGGPNQNNWNVTVTFQSVSGAQSYWYQIGNSNGGNNVTNTANQGNTVSTVFNNNTTYYARYAYANVSSTPLGSPQWSAFTSTTSLQCSH